MTGMLITGIVGVSAVVGLVFAVKKIIDIQRKVKELEDKNESWQKLYRTTIEIKTKTIENQKIYRSGSDDDNFRGSLDFMRKLSDKSGSDS